MQLLVALIKNKNRTTAFHSLCNKFTLQVVVLLHILLRVRSVTAELTCYQCRGINCLRTSYEATQKCLNKLDICVNVYDGETLMAQGCWEQLPEELRNKCDSGAIQTKNSKESRECFKCNENLCNSLSSSSFECLQCDSDSNENCRTNPLSLMPSRCGISRTPNAYCFVKQEGQRIVRGCSYTLEEQTSCLNSDNCMICQPSQLSGCNTIKVETHDEGDTADGGSGNNLGHTNERKCHQCSGINCLRTSYEATQKCLNDLDICVTVFEGQTVLAQGCWGQLTEEVRNKCDSDAQCLKCNENMCNNLASSSFQCIQCDSATDDNCRSNPLSLVPSRCAISRTPNEYCFVKKNGERVIRGCSYTLEEQTSCLSSGDCMICQPSEVTSCNNIKLAKDDGSSGGSGNTGNGGNGNEQTTETNGNGTGNGAGTGSENNGSDGTTTEDNSSGNNSDSSGGSSEDGGSNGQKPEDGGSGSGGGSEGGNTEGGNSGSGDGGSADGSNGSSSGLINDLLLIYLIVLYLVTK